MKKFRDFLKDTSGATALTFGLLLVPLLGVTGLAVDYSMASSERANLQNAADAAALAGAAVFTGSNSQEAENLARGYLRANLGDKANSANISVSAKDQKVTVDIGGQTNTLFMQLLKQDTVKIGVTSAAFAPLKPTSASITVGDVYGWYYKRVTIVGMTPAGSEKMLGTVIYNPYDHRGANGRGTGSTVPNKNQMTTINLDGFDKLYLKMEVKQDGCGLGYKNPDTNARYVKCVVDNSKINYDLTLKTNNGQQANYLFVDGKQLPVDQVPKILDILSCTGTHQHAWEDGGGWDQQDFFYTVVTTCKAVDGENVRLTN
ncbi:pilus assembly protein TadG-related protein [Phyllobacterium meliloti]|uniref:pilus assembly protein TadG-related protein n=1 Tax=Phyllobacterium meliloti TaxID=555317 RepID=UPI001D1395E8|nr:pilus assembly protein TadG-related protein [Phyllobacterium sp. T1293]UGX85410.1 pilus assembly protein TadG-related protein [Phyllobacterium sp. T1293]